MKIKQIVSLESVDRVYVGYLYNEAAALEFGIDNETINVTLTVTQLTRLRDYINTTLESHNKSQLEKARKALSEEVEV